MEKKKSRKHSSTGDVILRVIALLALAGTVLYSVFHLDNDDPMVAGVATFIFILALYGISQMTGEAKEESSNKKTEKDDSHSKEGD